MGHQPVESQRATACAGDGVIATDANHLITYMNHAAEEITKWKLQEGQSFTTSFLVEQSPEEAFDAINNVRGWWTENLEGSSQKLNDEFAVQFGDVHYSKQKVMEFIPGERIVWHVEEASLNFVDLKQEWVGTDIIFEIVQKNGKTEMIFTHAGLIPQFECYNACSNAWSTLIQSNLRNLIRTREVQPDAFKALD